MARFLQRISRAIIYHTAKNGGVLPQRCAKESLRFLADFAVTANEPKQ
jgi:hypothetical protein